MIKIYGIPNCDTIKKATKWLDKNKLAYEFYDYKKWGVPEKELKLWVKNAGWEIVLNKRSTTWKTLSDKIKKNTNQHSAIRIMLKNSSSIKRPVLIEGKKLIIGFKEDEYKTLL
ncbi:FIG138056: a glutathione-dependent thiol reductase [hydrothermal vent metagenome]|uniref:FIG138056: a glutathione-dependent thiol reductase n=1 Tax=hydrothermal vent metagenome TaxID=652676 RepID=A0A3B0X388_9ZZZZ